VAVSVRSNGRLSNHFGARDSFGSYTERRLLTAAWRAKSYVLVTILVIKISKVKHVIHCAIAQAIINAGGQTTCIPRQKYC